jgi:integrase
VSPFVFSLDEGPPSPARIGWWWTRARRAAGIAPQWRLHDLRHWTATAAKVSDVAVGASFGMVGDRFAVRALGLSPFEAVG